MACIDSMQLGNESIKGSNERAEDLNGNLTPMFCHANGDFTAFLGDGIDWIRAQAEAVRIGSALAGRPLRVIGPGFPLGVVNFGAEGDPFNGSLTNCEMDCDDLDECEDSKNKSALGMLEIAKILQSDRMYFDLHLHYKTVGQAYDTLLNMEDDSRDCWGNDGEYLPLTKVILEFSPKADDGLDEWEGDWHTQGGDSIRLTMNKFFDTQEDPKFDTWDKFIKNDDPQFYGWELTQYPDLGDGSGFRMEDLLNDIFDFGYSAVCYGPCQQGPNTGDAFKIAALRASAVPITSPSRICDETNKYSPILVYSNDYLSCTGMNPGADDYLTIIEEFVIEPFTPHCQDGEYECDDCSETRACPEIE